MKHLVVILFISSLSLTVFAQTNKEVLDEKVTNQLRYRGSLRQLPKQKEALRGDPFLYKEYVSGIIKFADENGREYSVQRMRYNALQDYLEILYNGTAEAIDGSKIDAMMFEIKGTKKYLINGKFWKNGNSLTNMSGFFQVLVKGEGQMLKKVNTYLKKATYNVALNVGANYDEILKKTEYYYAKKDQLYKITSKRSIYNFFKGTKFDAKSYIKKYKLKVKKEAGKRQLILAYNAFLGKNKYQKK